MTYVLKPETRAQLLASVQKIPRVGAVLVVGDVNLDEYVIGQATRMSREAPIPVLELTSRQFIAGGAGNPAANITALGAKAVQVGVIGQDAHADILRETLTAKQIDISGLIVDPTRPTAVKTRIMAHMGLRFPQQVARVDTLSREMISQTVLDQTVQAIQNHVQAACAVLFSDYRSGMITPQLVQDVKQALNGTAVLLTADAQGELEKYQGFDLVKCNADEARQALGRSLHTDEEFASAAQDLCQALALRRAMVITRGSDGMTIGYRDGDNTAVIQSRALKTVEVYDVVGAGDTTIAVLTLALCAGIPMLEAAQLANFASGLVVQRVGNYTPSLDELMQVIQAY